MKSVLLSERLETACRTFATLERQLADPAITGNPLRLQTIARERARLEPLVIDYRELRKLEQEQQETRNLLKGPAPMPKMRSWLSWPQRNWPRWTPALRN
jgi:peptide chain release factor 1